MKRLNITLGIQYFLFYVVLLIVPVIILGFIIHFYLMASLKSEVMSSNEQKLNQVKDVIDSHLVEMQNITSLVSSKGEFTPNYLTNYYQVMNAKEFLTYKIGNEFIHDVFYFTRDKEYLFTNKTSYNLDLFTENYYKFENWSNDEFYDDLTASKLEFLRPAEDVSIHGIQERMITYGVPIPVNNRSPYGTLLFMINEKEIGNMLKNVVSTSNGFAFIMNSKGEIIASFNGQNKEIKPVMNHLLAGEEEEFQEVSINNQSYYLSRVESKFKNLKYVAFTPEAHLMERVNKVKSKVLGSYILIIIAGGFLIFFAMHINYQPLRRLVQKAEENLDYAISGNGIEKVLEVIKHSNAANKVLSIKVEKSKPIIMQHLFSRFLRGGFHSYQQFNESAKDIDLSLNESSYFVMIFDFNEAPITNEVQQELVQSWIELLPNKEKYKVFLFEGSTIATILSGKVNNDQLNNWYEDLSKKSKYKITIGVGSSYEEASQVGKSHLEATTALDYKLIKGDDKIIFFNEIATIKSSGQWYDKQLIDELELYLKKNEKERAEQVIQSILEVIKHKDTNMFIAKCLIFDVSSTLMRVVQDIQLGNQKSLIDLPDIRQISDFRSSSDIEETLQLMIYKVFEIREKSTPEKDELLGKMIKFMEENYDDYQFSTQTLATHFNVTEAYIMRYFKKNTGQTILQFLIQLRIDQSKQLLKTTDIPIKDIVSQIGYSDVSSFIRRFKQQTKITPGEYRKRYSYAEDEPTSVEM